MRNIIEKTNTALLDKTFTNGLSSYTQANCQVTLTDTGYRIYRPANKTVSGDGNTMWGGFVLKPFNADANALVKGHTYVVAFEVKGKTSNAVNDINWSNNVGWGGGGLSPSPSNVVCTSIPANWQSDIWFPFQYKFSINDDIIKTCTSSYSSFVAGQQYISYRDFKFGFGYQDTGSMGTDLYIRNIRMYDISTKPNSTKVTKSGIFISENFIENTGTGLTIREDGDFIANDFIEI